MASAAKNIKAVATVRIAPTERWCKYETEKMALFPEVNYPSAAGFPVRIETMSMHMSNQRDCKGRLWKVRPETLQALYEHSGGLCDDPTFFCEHMLEMD